MMISPYPKHAGFKKRSITSTKWRLHFQTIDHQIFLKPCLCLSASNVSNAKPPRTSGAAAGTAVIFAPGRGPVTEETALDCYLEVTPTERHFGVDFDPGEDFDLRHVKILTHKLLLLSSFKAFPSGIIS